MPGKSEMLIKTLCADGCAISSTAFEKAAGEVSLSALPALRVRSAVATYDFTTLGGVTGLIGLGVTIPDKSVVISAYVDVITAPTSAASTATIGLGVNAAADLLAPVVVSNAQWTPAAVKATTVLGSAATCIKTTAARQLTMTVAVQNLTAGRFVVVCNYVTTG